MPANTLKSTKCTTMSVNTETKMLRLRKCGSVIYVASSAGHAGTSGQISTQRAALTWQQDVDHVYYRLQVSTTENLWATTKKYWFFPPLVNINDYNCGRLDPFNCVWRPTRTLAEYQNDFQQHKAPNIEYIAKILKRNQHRQQICSTQTTRLKPDYYCIQTGWQDRDLHI